MIVSISFNALFETIPNSINKNFNLINWFFLSDTSIAEAIKYRQSTKPLSLCSGQTHTTQICRVITQIYYRPTVAKICPLI